MPLSIVSMWGRPIRRAVSESEPGSCSTARESTTGAGPTMAQMLRPVAPREAGSQVLIQQHAYGKRPARRSKQWPPPSAGCNK